MLEGLQQPGIIIFTNNIEYHFGEITRVMSEGTHQVCLFHSTVIGNIFTGSQVPVQETGRGVELTVLLYYCIRPVEVVGTR